MLASPGHRIEHGGPLPLAANTLNAGQEARIFGALLKLRRQQRLQVLAEAQREADKASSSEEELVYAFDRADFVSEQLQRLSIATGLEGHVSMPRDSDDRRRRFDELEGVLGKHWELRKELMEQRDKAKLAAKRIRCLLLLMSSIGSPEDASSVDLSDRWDGLAVTLNSCKEALLRALAQQSCGVDSSSGENSRNEGVGVFLDTVLPMFIQGSLDDASPPPAEELSSPPVVDRTAISEEEARLRNLIRDLTTQNEDLMRELSEVPSTATSQPEDSPDELDEEESDLIAVRGAELRQSLAEAYEELAKVLSGGGTEDASTNVNSKVQNCNDLLAQAARNQQEIASLKERLKQPGGALGSPGIPSRGYLTSAAKASLPTRMLRENAGTHAVSSTSSLQSSPLRTGSRGSSTLPSTTPVLNTTSSVSPVRLRATTLSS
eukprot:TRINITY_DN35824_c0_g1_i1.p1 TRINITY_DN35824_c0_g1~~TRINITY_DN35824_c0_g1_i1.p1  ORF type:complete len:435 (-),score=96.87 TRINITY_DN35824_c0_g1_i1:77-1381(-)